MGDSENGLEIAPTEKLKGFGGFYIGDKVRVNNYNCDWIIVGIDKNKAKLLMDSDGLCIERYFLNSDLCRIGKDNKVKSNNTTLKIEFAENLGSSSIEMIGRVLLESLGFKTKISEIVL